MNGYVHAYCGPAAPQPYNRAHFRPYPEIPPEPYPAPEISSRDNVPAPEKIAVTRMARLAEGFGWTVVTTYARGHHPHATTGKPGAVKDSIALRMARGERRAVAEYAGTKTWQWITLWTWQRGTRPVRYELVSEFEQALL